MARATLLARAGGIEQPVEREQRHLDLLRRGQPGRVIESDRATVGDHPVDELEAFGRRRHGAVARPGRRQRLARRRGEARIERIRLVQADDAEPQPGRAPELRERIQDDGVPRGHRGERAEAVDERRVDVVGDHDQVRPLAHDLADARDRRRVHRDRRRIRRIHGEEGLHPRIARACRSAPPGSASPQPRPARSPPARSGTRAAAALRDTA